MAVTVRIPAPLRKLTDGQGDVTADGATVAQMVESLEKNHPGLKERLCDDSGSIRPFVNIYVNDEDIRFLKGPDTALNEGDSVSIVPAIAGG
ncbi:MAG: MoaD/ThiS family protein [Nitrospirota bacterium]|nr:MoaD/ThiS family protein [Nitrospirota bacterium]